ncbi:MAG: radical SAM protein [Deltaproteobacteria bacterium]|jgi:MoaA/NifB/PqqE/SkfB family radical SAM enzyme/glutamate dehydrogenase/leucine dehydrogenase|nr:radical SAM protein [Deltaproteobacteria bacterium]MBW2536272.1 radical SAM protein [Deltaproteobacteria bacterium]
MRQPPDDQAAAVNAAAELAGEIRPGLTYRFDSKDAAVSRLFSVRFRLTRRCNRSCTFCFIPYQAPLAEEQDVAAAMEQALRGGVRKVVLTGGEPLLHEGLGDLVAEARSLGAQWVEVQSNGLLLAQDDRCRELADAGVTSVTVSVPSHRDAVLEELTGVPASFGKITRGLENLMRFGVDTSVTHVLTPQNVADVGEFVRFLWERQLCHKLCFLFAAPIVPALARPDRILRFSDGVGPLEEALDYCLDHRIPFEGLSERCGLPECLLSGDARYYGEAPPIVDANRATDFFDAPACAVCSRRRYCYRVRALYAYLYGVSEFRPVLEPGVLGEAPVPTGGVVDRAIMVPRRVSARPAAPSGASVAATGAGGSRSDAEPGDPVEDLLGPVARQLGLGDEAIAAVVALDTEWSTVVDVQCRDGSTVQVPGWRVRHGASQGPTVGALEISAELDAARCRAAAIFRGLRAAALGLAMGGAHGGLGCELAALDRRSSSDAVAELLAGIGGAVGGGVDCITPHTSVPWGIVSDAADAASLDATEGVRLLSARPVDSRGRPARMPSVSSAVAAALLVVARYRQLKRRKLRYGIVGFGRAGRRIAALLSLGPRPTSLVACADSRSACLDAAGLDAGSLRAHKAARGCLPEQSRVTHAEVVAADVDVLFLTAPEVPFGSTAADAVRARVLVDMTGTLARTDELVLLEQNCFVVPSSVATCGPMIATAIALEGTGTTLSVATLERSIARHLAELLPKMLHIAGKYGLTMTEAFAALGMQALGATLSS